VRVYLPTTPAGLRELAGVGSSPGRREGYAATAAVRAELAGCSDEELEFALAAAAAEASAQEQLDGGRRFGRRIVLVLEVPDTAAMTLDDQAGLIRVEGVGTEALEAIMADPNDIELSGADDVLAWYAVQELADLLA
jgi:hypothetical protein